MNTSQRKSAAKPRVARALESVLRAYADPVRRHLAVKTAVRAGGIDMNHSRRALVVA